MACPCCSQEWLCYQCCCPDGSDARKSVGVRIEASSSCPAPAFQTLEGNYTLALDYLATRTDPAQSRDIPYFGNTCVEYSVSVGTAQAGCRGVFSGLSKYIGLIQTTARGKWIHIGWSGLDNQGRCCWLVASTELPGSAAFCSSASPGTVLSAFTTLLFLDSGSAVSFRCFDIYIS